MLGKRIGVLLGGGSPERAVSIATGQAVLTTLLDAGHDAVAIYADGDLDLGLRQARVEVAFLALHGRSVAGPIQGLLESLGIPYTGSSLGAASLAADKLKSKELMRLHNLATPPYYCHLRGAGRASEQHGAFGYPCVAKPRSGGSGIGVSLIRGPEELDAAIETALRLDDEVLVERFVGGREIQVAILDGVVLGAAEVLCEGGGAPPRALLRRSDVTLPPRLAGERLSVLYTQALRAHELLGCDGLTRVDFLVPDHGNETLLEVNACPELAPHASVPKISHAAGLSFTQLVERILAGARSGGRRSRSSRPSERRPWLLGTRRSALPT